MRFTRNPIINIVLVIKNVILILSFFCCVHSIQAQDQHFSQFYSSPMTLNPALTGAFNAKYRLGIINRDQWRSVLDNPYRTFAVSLEVKFGLDYFLRFAKRDKVAVGLLFYNDKVEGVDFRESKMALSLAYHKSLDKEENNVLTLGFQAGVLQRNISFGELIFDDQFNEIDEFNLPTNELFPVNNFTFGDYSVGLNYANTASKKVSIFAGAALHHIFEPSISFYEDRQGNQLNQPLPRNITGHAGATIVLNNRYQISPRFMILSQGPHLQINGGANLRIRIDEYGRSGIYVGAWTRLTNDMINGIFNDAIIAMVGLEIDGFLMGLSYDLNTRALAAYNTRQGSFEISLAYLGEYDNETILCPKF